MPSVGLSAKPSSVPAPPPCRTLDREHRSWQRLPVHDRQPTGAPGEGHVKRTHTRWRLGDDPGRLDDDDRIELEALGITQREQADLGIEGSGTDLTADDALPAPGLT